MLLLKNSILLLSIAILVFASSTPGQVHGPPTSRPKQEQSSSDAKSNSVCRGKLVAVSMLERPAGMAIYSRRTSYLGWGISEPARLVIRDRNEFNELWNQIMRSVTDKPSLPEVDFSREMLIVAAMGHRPTLYEIIVDSACEVDNQLEVLIRITKIPWCGAHVGLPPETVDIVRLPKTDRTVIFRETERTIDCKDLFHHSPS